MAESDTLKLFCVVLALVIVALATMGCVQQESQSQDASPQVIYDGQESPAGSVYASPSPSVAANSQPGESWTQKANDSGRGFGNRTSSPEMLQAAIDACTGKSAGDSCTVSFGSGNFTGNPQGMQPPGSNGTMPAGPAGNGTMPSGMPQGQMQPTGTCQTVNSTLSCTMQRPARG